MNEDLKAVIAKIRKSLNNQRDDLIAHKEIADEFTGYLSVLKKKVY